MLPPAHLVWRILMKLFAAIYNDARLLTHFLSHYQSAGVKEFFIAVHPALRAPVAEFSGAYQITIFDDLDVTDTPIGHVSAVTEMRHRFQKPSEWVVIVDLDEFIELPSDVDGLLHQAEAEGANIIRGIMWDRFSRDGQLPGFGPHSDLRRLYPVRARFTRDVMEGADYKGVLVKGWLRSNAAHHVFHDEIIFSKSLEISHYKWFEGALERVAAAHRLVVEAGEPWAIEYQRVLDHYRQHGRFAWEQFGGELVYAEPAENARVG
jgi:hypothetical protein